MELHNIPEAFYSRVRLAIIVSLVTGTKTFNELRKIAQTTDGNLGAHLIRLEEMGYISCAKSFVGRKPQSAYTITAAGREAFIAYVNLLEATIHVGEQMIDTE